MVEKSTCPYSKSNISIKTDELYAAVSEDHVLNVCLIFHTKCHAALRPVGWGVQGVRPNPPTAWKGPVGGLPTNNLTGLKQVSHV